MVFFLIECINLSLIQLYRKLLLKKTPTLQSELCDYLMKFFHSSVLFWF
jgi:hypothetical protein